MSLGDISITDKSPPTAPELRQFVLADESGFELRALTAKKGISIKALPSGRIYSIERGEILVNQVLASPLADGIHRIYLRIRENGGLSWLEIVGPRAAGEFDATADRFRWTGSWRGLEYQCICRILTGGDAWAFQLRVENRSETAVNCDAILLQDLGLATRGQVRNNERYTSQYLDHLAVPHQELGYLLMTRQNLPQGNKKHPWLLQGCFPGCAGFTTDGFDFFGVEYKVDGVPAALSRQSIGDRVRQYEAGYTAIQSIPSEISRGARHTWSFFSHFAADHPEPSRAADADEATLRNLRSACEETASALNPLLSPGAKPSPSLFQAANLFESKDFTDVDLRRHFPGPFRHEEFDRDRRLSFFFGADSHHVALKAKELAVARPHGHIMRAGPGLMPDSEVMSSTSYAAGVFACQLAVGNTVFGKFLSTVRDSLNIVRSGGLRMFVRLQPSEPWSLLAIPSAFEMAPNSCRWHYKGDVALLTVSCHASDDDPVFTFTVKSGKNPVELLICGEISAGPQEYDSNPLLTLDIPRGRLKIRPDHRSLLAQNQPEIALHAVTSTPRVIETIGGAELLGATNGSASLPYFAIRTHPTRSFSLSFVGTTEDASRADALCSKYENPDAVSVVEHSASSRFWRETAGAVQIHSSGCAKASEIQDALAWFARDATIHFSVPRGLEQANGGAWGVRDVCQGPVEFLLSYHRGDVVKTILRELFSQQYRVRGDWPQWFMFPPFQQIQARTAHGDILIWPLKALCDYLEDTNDGDILRHTLPYTDDETLERGQERETILEHVDQLVKGMRQQFLPGISLPRYGEGDWDDSLQPTDPTFGERMASSWTVALMYQTLRRYGAALERFGEHERSCAVNEMAGEIRAGFHRYLMPDGVVAGFTVFDVDARCPAGHLLHPRDTHTGVHYRLISMTRGILSGIFSAEEANTHLDLLQKHLLFPDGARLMDRPTTYRGGREIVFHRSESAAFFGREIGLQYVHAHLRYAEALAALGRSRDLLDALMVVNPISATEVVANASLRQRNCYFTSSDAAFSDRYQASRDFDKLRKGEVPVDGGWRIYSSGPGIYTYLVIRHLFGIRRHFDFMEFDPILPGEFDGISCELPYKGHRVRYQFSVSGNGEPVKRLAINGVEITSFTRGESPYRTGGIRIPKAEFESRIGLAENVVQIEL
jgi:1,2-beta-oligoglucan phosphorylase